MEKKYDLYLHKLFQINIENVKKHYWNEINKEVIILENNNIYAISINKINEVFKYMYLFL
jgi:hypothetical protein